ncbi:MAG: hypothetical protein P8Y03_21025 [Anaerolineales bacterium]
MPIYCVIRSKAAWPPVFSGWRRSFHLLSVGVRPVRPAASGKTEKVDLPLSLRRHNACSLVDRAGENWTFTGGLTLLAFSQDQYFSHTIDSGHIDLGIGIPGAAGLAWWEQKHALCARPQCPFTAKFFPGMRAGKVDLVPADFGQSLILPCDITTSFPEYDNLYSLPHLDWIIRCYFTYRICFNWSETGPEQVEIVDYH